MNHMIDLIKLMRPFQWYKNGFVFTGLLFSNETFNVPLLLKVILATIAFSLASSAIYVFNDVIDCENDRHHPEKKERPIAKGIVSIPAAISLSIGTGLAGLLLGLLVSWQVLIIILAYIALNLAYSYRLKNVVIVDVFCIAAGFMLRILAGTIGVGIPPSKWLLLCGLLITLFLGFAKRRAEMLALSNKEEHRKVLHNYGAVLLDEIMSICAAGVIISYSLYTMSPETIATHNTENLIYTLPFVIYGIFRYIYILHHRNSGGDPSRDLLKDRHIIGVVMGWALLTTYLIMGKDI